MLSIKTAESPKVQHMKMSSKLNVRTIQFKNTLEHNLQYCTRELSDARGMMLNLLPVATSHELWSCLWLNSPLGASFSLLFPIQQSCF
jgi:hypothetical protein